MFFNVTEWNKNYKIDLNNPSITITFQNTGEYHIEWGYQEPVAKPTNQPIQIDIYVDYMVEPI